MNPIEYLPNGKVRGRERPTREVRRGKGRGSRPSRATQPCSPYVAAMLRASSSLPSLRRSRALLPPYLSGGSEEDGELRPGVDVAKGTNEFADPRDETVLPNLAHRVHPFAVREWDGEDRTPSATPADCLRRHAQTVPLPRPHAAARRPDRSAVSEQQCHAHAQPLKGNQHLGRLRGRSTLHGEPKTAEAIRHPEHLGNRRLIDGAREVIDDLAHTLREEFPHRLRGHSVAHRILPGKCAY